MTCSATELSGDRAEISTVICPKRELVFSYFFETGSHYILQASPEFDPPASAS
jgi:hypothetical protein